jgi:hypothetical protein
MASPRRGLVSVFGLCFRLRVNRVRLSRVSVDDDHHQEWSPATSKSLDVFYTF